MNYLSIEELTKSFGERVLFEGLTFGIEQGQKAAIVAKNGSGKTTLLRCIMGKESFDSGRIVFRNDLRIAYLEQTDILDSDRTVLEEILSSDLPELNAVKRYNLALANNDEHEIGESFQEISELNAWDVESNIQQIMGVFKLDKVTQKIGDLSGGQKKRIALAK
ncbi:MAG: ATP-binding cassette domain-containing protein, partial [Crocinitomicaceae bacterium]